MKTKILLGGALLLLSASYIADAATVWTTCGRGAMTVDKSFFEKEADWDAYLRDINEFYCGDRGSDRKIIESPWDNNYFVR